MHPAWKPDEPVDDIDPIVEGLSEIIKGLQPGQRLPSERDLAVRMGVSRTALRDRLQQAEALGVLRRTVGSGTYVEQINPRGLAIGLQLAIDASQLSLGSLHPVRVALERQAAHDAAVSHLDESMEEMREALRYMGKAAEAEDMTGMADADAMFHRALMEAPGNAALSFFGHAMAKVRRDAMRSRARQLSLVDREPSFIVNLHAEIHDAIRAGDPIAAAQKVDAHFAEFTAAVVEIGQHPYSE